MRLLLAGIIILFYLLMPLFVLRLCYLSKIADKIGAVLICYAIGIILGQFCLSEEWLKDIPNVLSTIIIPLALPMLLFDLDIKSWSKMAWKALLSMILSCISLVIMIVVGFYFFRGQIEDINKVGGMLSGLYTGGTPNLASLKIALNVNDNLYLAVNTVDIVVSAVFLLFLISIAKKVLGWFLPFPCTTDEKGEDGTTNKQKRKPFLLWLNKVSIGNILVTTGVSLLIAIVGAGIGFLLIKDPAVQMAVVILTITTLAILASNTKVVKKVQGSFDVGMYLILIFSIAVASMADFTVMSKHFLPLMGYISISIFGTLILHVIWCRVFKIDVDTLMVTSVALICSPPFVPIVSAAIKNKKVLMSGITVGVIGYAIGNYLGVLISLLLSIL